MKRSIVLLLVMLMVLAPCAYGETGQTEEILITDMIGREVTVTPGSYQRVACIGAGALRMYTYIGDVSLIKPSSSASSVVVAICCFFWS